MPEFAREGEFGREQRVSRLAALFGTAVLAYLVSLQFIFPGYIALPVPFHNDMYWALEFVAKDWNFAFFLHWPRPVFYETLLLAGHFGLEGSLVFLTAIVLFDLALAVAELERFVLKERVPLWIAFLTFLLAMAGPGFFGQPGFDVGFHLALLFGLLGIWAWEARGRFESISWLVAAICFCLSTLANESFAPALVLYGVVCAVRERRFPASAAAALALPVLALGVSFADGQLTHSPFVTLHAPPTSPYRVDLTFASLLHCAGYYVSGLLNPAFLALAIVCGAGLWRSGRLPIGLGITCAALALYTPYVVLPNHLTDIYQWTPMPLLMLVVPLAWSAARTHARLPVLNTVLALAVVGSIAFLTTQYAGDKSWYRTSLATNRATIAALREHSKQIGGARRVLVEGVAFVMNPWEQNAASISRIIPFNGRWFIETASGVPPVEVQRNAEPVRASRISGYDLVLRFGPGGGLVTIR